MARSTEKQKKEYEEAVRHRVEQSRHKWLGKQIRFRDLLDKKFKVGVITEINDNGTVVLEYQAFPWPDEPAYWYGEAGREQELLDMIEGKVVS